MKIYFPRDKDFIKEEIERLWPLYADMTCVDCGKEHALSNTANGRCIRCGGECK